MQAATVPLACFLSLIRPPGIQFENALLQIAPVNKGACPFVRDNNDVVFQLYTRHNPTVAHSLLIDDDERLFASSIDFNDNTVIYFHAFMETPDDGSALIVREAYTHRGDTNVIVVDAQRLEAGPWYFKAAANTWYIGRIGAQFIDYLVSRGLKLSKTHLVGHSLGAQAAGVAGSTLQSGRVSRITGLDPALPLFDKLPLQQRLDPSDAEFVDIIHTDAGIFGYNQQIGHVDFYPNGGISPQPGCELEVVVPKQMVLNKFFCSHWRSYMFFSESVLRPTSFLASKCHSWKEYARGFCAKEPTTHMGFGVDLKYVGTSLGWKDFRALLLILMYLEESDRRLACPGNKNTRLNGYLDFNLQEMEQRDGHGNTRNRTRNLDAIIRTEKKRLILIKDIRKQVNIKVISKFRETETNGFSALMNISNSIKPNKLSKRFENITESPFRNFELNKKFKLKTFQKTPYTHKYHSLKEPEKIKSKTVLEFRKTMSNNKNEATTKPTVFFDSKNIHSTDKQKIKRDVNHRQRRFIPFLKLSQTSNNDNMLFRILGFLLKHHKKIAPTLSTIKEIYTIIKTSNGELQNVITEQNNYSGTDPGAVQPISSTYNIDIGNESKFMTFLRKLLGVRQGNKLVITSC